LVNEPIVLQVMPLILRFLPDSASTPPMLAYAWDIARQATGRFRVGLAALTITMLLACALILLLRRSIRRTVVSESARTRQ
jgi:hypothetical protein